MTVRVPQRSMVRSERYGLHVKEVRKEGKSQMESGGDSPAAAACLYPAVTTIFRCCPTRSHRERSTLIPLAAGGCVLQSHINVSTTQLTDQTFFCFRVTTALPCGGFYELLR